MPQDNGKKEITRHVNELIAQLKNKTYKSPFSQDFAEIYIENDKNAQRGETVSQKITSSAPPPDEKRDLFLEMRRLVQTIGLGVPGDRLQTILFYRQAKFMENFEDDYEDIAPFSMYFPNYQMMGYEQLRTYFTWRSKVREGVVEETSFSYVFVYIYELINNIGVQSCEDGLCRLVFIWNEYRKYENKLDKYMNGWVRDYYITNDFAATFEEFLRKNANLQKLYKYSTPRSFFDFYYPYSNYKVKQSAFYTPQTAKLISECFNHVIKTLNEFTVGKNAAFDDLIFYKNNGNTWKPFSKALYCLFSRETQNKLVQISDTEKYSCENGHWTSSKNRIPKENGRFIIGYVFRRIEQFFRKATKYKYKLTADRKKIAVAEIGRLLSDPESLFTQIDDAIAEYNRLSQRKVITVNVDQLETIRENAQMIQDRLLVNAEETGSDIEISAAEPAFRQTTAAEPENKPLAEETADGWAAFAHSLNRIEKTAVHRILQNASMSDLHTFSKDNRMMLEVLVDNINQKAIDTVSDSIVELSDEITVFEEYRDELERVISIELQ